MTPPEARPPAHGLPDILVRPVVEAALVEDLGRAGDVTAALLDAGARLSAAFVARRAGVAAGLACARLAVHALDPAARFEAVAADGDALAPGAVLARVEGDARALLSAERTALNLLGRMGGIATLTAAYVRAVEGTGVRILDTRKTIPGLRALEKHAVRCGGGVNHRFGLDDAILIKDNHVAACGGVAEALRRAQALAGWLAPVEVEVDRLDQLDEALPFAPSVVLLDNFAADALREAVRRRDVAGLNVPCAKSGPCRGPAWTGSAWARSPTPRPCSTSGWTPFEDRPRATGRPIRQAAGVARTASTAVSAFTRTGVGVSVPTGARGGRWPEPR